MKLSIQDSMNFRSLNLIDLLFARQMYLILKMVFIDFKLYFNYNNKIKNTYILFFCYNKIMSLKFNIAP